MGSHLLLLLHILAVRIVPITPMVLAMVVVFDGHLQASPPHRVYIVGLYFSREGGVLSRDKEGSHLLILPLVLVVCIAPIVLETVAMVVVRAGSYQPPSPEEGSARIPRTPTAKGGIKDEGGPPPPHPTARPRGTHRPHCESIVPSVTPDGPDQTPSV